MLSLLEECGMGARIGGFENLGCPIMAGRPFISHHNIEMSPSHARDAYPVTAKDPSPGKIIYFSTLIAMLTPILAAVERQKKIVLQALQGAKLAAELELSSVLVRYTSASGTG